MGIGYTFATMRTKNTVVSSKALENPTGNQSRAQRQNLLRRLDVDSQFAGNTPSELALPEGEHTITVIKSGYKDWQRSLKVSPGSSIHLNAEMEKPADAPGQQ